MKLIIGIGNPDEEYLATRHNVGWQFLDWLLKKYGSKNDEWRSEAKLNAEVVKTEIEGIKAVLAKPTTFVNRSGDAARRLKPWAKAKNEDIVIVQDDLDIPFGNCKLSFEKNSGGHRGVESIMSALKTKKFWRVRIGLGSRALDKARAQSDKKRDEWVRDYVLKKFTPKEQETLKTVFKDCEVRLMQTLKS